MRDKALLKKLNFIEIYQFFGGLIGILLFIYLIFTTNASEKYAGLFYILLIVPFLFFVFCLYSAWLLNKKKYLRGLNLAIISLILQLIAFEFYGFYYTSVNGIAINFTLDLTNDTLAGFDFQPSRFLLAFQNNNILRFKLNLFAIGMLVFVSKIIKEVKSTSLYSIV